MRNNKPRRITTKYIDYIPIHSLKSNTGNLNIIENGLRCYDFSNGQYADLSFNLHPGYVNSTPIKIELIVGKKIDDAHSNIKFKLEIKPILGGSEVIESNHILDCKENGFKYILLHTFKHIKSKENVNQTIHLCRITRMPVSEPHPNSIWIYGIQITYNYTL